MTESTSETIPLVEETVSVGVRQVVTGRVSVRTLTESFDELVHQELRGTRAEVERFPIGRTLLADEEVPGPRTEGGVTIIPIFEEIMVVEKRLVLKEELHITQVSTVEVVEMPVTLRRQRAAVERLPADSETDENLGAEDV